MGKVNENTFSIKGESGTKYTFSMYNFDTEFKDVGGIYIFTNRTNSNDKFTHNVIYIGKTNDLSTRFDNHHKADCINRNESNCICVKQVDSEKERTKIETDLLIENQTNCNEINNL